MSQIRKRLTYANVISTIALFLVLGGATAFAASQLEKESVGANQLKKGAVTPAKLSKASKATLTGPAGAQGPKGAPGAPGSPGIQGPKGDAGTSSLTHIILIQTSGTGTVSAECNPGEHITGGGAIDNSAGTIKSSYPNTGSGNEPANRWTAIASNGADSVTVRILCGTP